MPDLAKKITPGFQALLVIISILTAFISISYLPMHYPYIVDSVLPELL